MSFQWIESLKEQQFAILNHQLEIKDLTQGAQELTQLLSGTHKMDQELELDYLLDQEKLFQETAELLSELLLVEVEMKSQLWRLEFCSTNSKDLEKDSLKLLVLEWIQLTIPTVVVTTSTWVSQEQSIDSHQLVKK